MKIYQTGARLEPMGGELTPMTPPLFEEAQ